MCLVRLGNLAIEEGDPEADELEHLPAGSQRDLAVAYRRGDHEVTSAVALGTRPIGK